MIGLDEVGRGSLAGPLLVCALRFNSKVKINGLNDSKKLTAKRRTILSKVIVQRSNIGYGWVEANEIDDIGLSKAMVLACERAIKSFGDIGDEIVIIDGNINYLPEYNTKTIIKADELIPEVSAASIVAKVKRDEILTNLAINYSHYGFEKNKGYGTKEHIRAIQHFGYCAEHRRSYKIKV